MDMNIKIGHVFNSFLPQKVMDDTMQTDKQSALAILPYKTTFYKTKILLYLVY
jgi:hypothetical protein